MENDFPDSDGDFRAPDGLSDRATELWHAVVPSRGRSAERLAAIEQALRALTLTDQAAAELAVAGSLTTTTKSSGAMHINPLTKVERENRAQFVRLWRALNLTINRREDGHNP